jgi:opacity protein-like surface antigen
MKLKSLLAAALLSCGFLSAQAQKGPEIGLITGYNTTWVIDSKLFDDPNYQYRTTWNSAPFGIQLGYKVNPSSTFQLQFYKNNMGAEYDIKSKATPLSDEKTVGEKVIELEYWSLPLLYKFTTGEKVRFNFHFGPQFSFLSKGSEINTLREDALLKVNLESTDLTTDAAASFNTATFKKDTYVMAEKEDFNKTDFGATLGLGLEADITNNLYFSANAKLYYGFKDVRGDDWVSYEKERNYYDSRNNVTGGFQLGIHYRFDL